MVVVVDDDMVAIDDALAVELFASMTIQPAKLDTNNLWPLHRMEPLVLRLSIQAIEFPNVIPQLTWLWKAMEQPHAHDLYDRTSHFIFSFFAGFANQLPIHIKPITEKLMKNTFFSPKARKIHQEFYKFINKNCLIVSTI